MNMHLVHVYSLELCEEDVHLVPLNDGQGAMSLHKLALASPFHLPFFCVSVSACSVQHCCGT